MAAAQIVREGRAVWGRMVALSGYEADFARDAVEVIKNRRG